MPVGVKNVKTQVDFLPQMRRIGAVEGSPNIINFIQSKRITSDLVKEKVKLLDETDAAPLNEFTSADDVVKEANTIEQFGNAVQIFATTVRISTKATLVEPDVRWSVRDEINDALKELRFKLGKAILSDNTPKETEPMRMGGIGYFVDGTNGKVVIDVPTGDKLKDHADQLEEAINDINEFIASKRESGADVIAMSPSVKRAFNRIGNATRFVDVSKNEINDVINVYISDFGAIYGYYDPAMAGREEAYLFRKSDVVLGHLGNKSFTMEKLGKRGTFVEWFIEGYLTILTNKYSVGKIEINRV